MPSPQPLSSNVANGSDAGSANLHNNGFHRSGSLDSSGQSTATINGVTKVQLGTESPKTSGDHSNESAKSHAAASRLSSERATAPSSRLDAVSERSISAHQSHGNAQSRKRSRSGSRLSRSPRGTQSNGLRSDRNQAFLETYVNREQLHTAAVIAAQRQNHEMIQQLRREPLELNALQRDPERYNIETFGLGYAGYGNGLQDVPPGPQAAKLITPAQRRPPGKRTTKELRVSRKDQATQAEQVDELIPIRLDIESDNIRLRDTFTWNIHDRVVDPKLFAQTLLEDMNPTVPQTDLVSEIVKSMQEQISDFHPHMFSVEEALDPHLPYFAYKNDEMRIVIKLNITIGQQTLVDQFEWDINNPLNSPEEFAKNLASDLSLSGEFTTAIAHSIREQCQLFTRSLYVTGHAFDGRPVEDHELLGSFLASPLPSIFRPHQAAKDFHPYLYQLSEQELEKNELSISREERRQKRSVNRRGGPALPDLKDRRRTIRTLLVSSVLPGAVQSHDDSRLIKRTIAANRGKRGIARMDGLDDTDDSDSEVSSIDSPAVPSHLLPGTARTRGLRGAATAAQATTRANLGRSATPDSAILHHHETRTSGRRIVHDESSPEPPTTKIIKLRLPRQKFRQLLQNLSAKPLDNAQSTPIRPTSRQSSTAPAATPVSMGPPTSTPRMQSQSLPGPPGGTPNSQSSQAPQTSKHGATSQLGRVDATGPPGPDHPIPPPPATLLQALGQLQAKYPNDLFEGTMRYTAVSKDTDEPFTIRSDAPHPPNTKYCYYPRIKCKDCPGKLYTPDLNLGVNNFEVHLKNRHHRDKVAKRVQELSKD